MWSLDVAQPFATVRGRPREARMAVPIVSSRKGVTFGGYTRRVASFRVAGVALRDIRIASLGSHRPLCRTAFMSFPLLL